MSNNDHQLLSNVITNLYEVYYHLNNESMNLQSQRHNLLDRSRINVDHELSILENDLQRLNDYISRYGKTILELRDLFDEYKC